MKSPESELNKSFRKSEIEFYQKNGTKKTTFRPSRYVLQQEESKTSNKRREISVGKSRNLMSANGSRVGKKAGKERKESKETVRKQECRKKDEAGGKDAAGDFTDADVTTNRALVDQEVTF